MILSLAGAAGHLFHHRKHQLAIAVVQARRIAANLGEKAHLVLAEPRRGFVSVLMNPSKKLRERHLHGPGDFRQRIERGDGMPVLNPRQITAQQTGTFFNVALGHAFLQTVVADGFADVHGSLRVLRGVGHGGTCIVIIASLTGKKNLVTIRNASGNAPLSVQLMITLELLTWTLEWLKGAVS